MQIIDAQIMPPDDSPQPTDAERAAVLAFLDDTVHYVDCNHGDPGRVTIRRLNRAEYNNTVRDLVGIDIRPADIFPTDEVGYGFDNIGDVLALPPLLMEKYLDAADKIASAAIVVCDPAHPNIVEVKGRAMERTNVVHNHGDEDAGAVILVSTGHVSFSIETPVGGKYRLAVKASETPAGNDPSQMKVEVDGQEKRTFEVGVRADRPKDFTLEVPLARGHHQIKLSFLNDFYDEKAKDKNRRDRNLIIWSARTEGPLKVDQDGWPESHRAIVAFTPESGMSPGEAARKNLEPFANRAFRRPVKFDELEQFAQFVEQAMQDGESFEFGMRVAVQAILVSPHFLFRVETDKNPADPKDLHPLNDYELASRLSYFLWSSMPDAELFAHAKADDLHTTAVLDAQVKRMLQDPRSSALVQNFGDQWLQLRVLDEATPDPKAYPDFNDALKSDMRQETRKFFEAIVREDRSILDFLSADYTFVNERLAKHYNMPGVKGGEFRKVSLAGTNRSGVLTQASILTLTSNPDRTSPVKRGKWIMETILDSPPPPPPPNVPELTDTAKGSPNLSLRQQMELHRSNPACASCHKTMDTLGFGLENFDVTGRYRDKDHGKPLDTAGVLPGGESFAGPTELANILKTSREKAFTKCLSEKLLTYALGRGLEYYDRCTINQITGSLNANNHRFAVLVSEIVKSEPFRMRRGEGAQP